MLRLSLKRLATRTPGYVFWRQRTLTELEHSKRNYLLMERPVPIAEVARRMVRVRGRYEATQDYHERALLRGEYKYFTGKLCDTRAAQLSDLVAFLECGAFFGLWDTAQVERVMLELLRQTSQLTANEMVHLFVCLPALRKEASELYRRLAEELVDVVPELTTEECVRLCSACGVEQVPASLLHNVLVAIETNLRDLSTAQLVEVLDTLSAAPDAVQQQFRALFDSIRTSLLRRVDELDNVELAIVYTTLKALEDCPANAEMQLLQAYVTKMKTGCARSTAMLFSAVANSPATALWLCQAMGDRVVFLSTDFTPVELLAVLKVYLTALIAVSSIAESHASTLATHGSTPPSSARVPVSSASSSLSTVGAASSLPQGTRRPPVATTSHHHTTTLKAELVVARQRVTALQHVLSELSDQLVAVLETATAFLSCGQQLELLEVYADALDDLTTAGVCDPARHLADLVPQTKSVLRLLSGKLIAQLSRSTLPEVVQVLELSNTLGKSLWPDAVVAAAVRELVVRDVDITGQAAVQLVELLGSLTSLRAEHQRRLNEVVVPKIRTFAS